MTKELKTCVCEPIADCPFCGGRGKRPKPRGVRWVSVCRACGASVEGATFQDAILAWNRRPQETRSGYPVLIDNMEVTRLIDVELSKSELRYGECRHEVLLSFHVRDGKVDLSHPIDMNVKYSVPIDVFLAGWRSITFRDNFEWPSMCTFELVSVEYLLKSLARYKVRAICSGPS